MKMDAHANDYKASEQAGPIQEPKLLDDDGGIDPENEITGPRLLLVHTGLCLCTLLVGLVRHA